MPRKQSPASTRNWPLWKAFHNAERLLTGGRGAPMLPLEAPPKLSERFYYLAERA